MTHISIVGGQVVFVRGETIFHFAHNELDLVIGALQQLSDTTAPVAVPARSVTLVTPDTSAGNTAAQDEHSSGQQPEASAPPAKAAPAKPAPAEAAAPSKPAAAPEPEPEPKPARPAIWPVLEEYLATIPRAQSKGAIFAAIRKEIDGDESALARVLAQRVRHGAVFKTPSGRYRLAG